MQDMIRGDKLRPDQIVLFTDFDGTVSIGDVGNRLFDHFSDGRSRAAVERWQKGEIDSRQCLLDEAAAMRPVTEAELFAFIDTFSLDSGLAGLVDFARDLNVPLYILSDGLDLYIKRLLARHGLAGLPFFANRASLEGGRLHLEFPYYDLSCGRCANCKGHHIRKLRGPGQKAVYIGDGRSDLCALPEADLVFAKDFLAQYCRQNGRPYYSFDNLAVVTETLRKIISR